MKDIITLLELYTNYQEFKASNYIDRYLSFDDLEFYLNNDLKFKVGKSVLGYSVLGKPIYRLNFGKGRYKILMWSQMHGNESTTTKALFDFLNVFALKNNKALITSILENCTLCVIPILNPDGADRYTRLNANDVDLNRDAVNKSQPETQSFFKYFKEFKPDFCFNLHGQRTIFGAGCSGKPSTVSFLAPSFDNNCSIDKSREKSMHLIAEANKVLQDIIPGQVGRYDDAHNINCFGDYIQNKKIPTVLFEAGHYTNDYNRETVRKIITISIFSMLNTIIYESQEFDNTEYLNIPFNKDCFFDIIIENVKNIEHGCIGVQFNEELKQNKVNFIPFVKRIGNLEDFKAHKRINAKLENIKINNSESIEEQVIIKSLKIGEDYIDLNPLLSE